MELYHLITSLFKQEATMELMRMGVVYAHLIACCVAIGLVLTSDFAMIKALVTGKDDAAHSDKTHLETLKNTVLLALAALWVTGIGIVLLDYSVKGAVYFLNPKLQAKILIVTLLTVNGFLLHHVVLPAITKAGTLVKMEVNARTLAVFSGVVSGVSWFYAAMLGIARPLSWKYSLGEIMFAYPLFICLGFVAMTLLVKWASNRAENLTPSRVSPALASA
ncbi:hypothetical protein [Metapseudomonas resinovorans]|uniref:Uncharacterized protein n=1 Tax=Metapseudomonas resinovorans NBRC 106553 TaxID=1245471 RepID=S6AL44_METRE|nr:hypothetical protein [Pseudomonas resinovorans]BAN49435.1 hypothetical protein PCA10_37030 [Pseudomonas resinovorans NBRC 106553]